MRLASEILRVPAHGFMAPVLVSALPWTRAEEAVQEANQRRTAFRNLETRSPISKMEIALCAGFFYYNMEPSLQFPIGPFDADFFFPAGSLLVEVDGREFHSRKRDQVRDAILAQKGYRTMRFSGRHVFADPLRCARDVQQQLLMVAA